MAEPMVTATSLSRVRRRALLPRRAFVSACVVLGLLGLRSLFVTPAPPAAAASPASPQLRRQSAEGFAQAFARAYLSWDAARPEEHAAGLAPFLGPDVDVDAGMPVPVRGRSRVTWTAAMGETNTDAERVVITVAVATDADPRLRYLAVPVTAGGGGTLTVADYPALVGNPAPAPISGRAGDDVADNALATVVRRALANYLDGEADNLRADLLPGARLALPREHLELDDVDSLQWAGRARGRVSAVVVARDPSGDVAYTLRYELRVAKRDRWYVAEINPPMTRKESP